jgi:hypothetical protein
MNEIDTGIVEFQVRLSTSELRSALFGWSFRRPWTWLLLCIGSLLLLASAGEYLLRHTTPGAGLWIGVAWILLPFLLPVLQTRQATLTAEGLAAATYMLDANGVQRQTSGTAVELAWNVLYGFRETSSAFLLLTNKNCFFVIPKRLLPPNELMRVAKIFSANLKRR